MPELTSDRSGPEYLVYDHLFRLASRLQDEYELTNIQIAGVTSTLFSHFNEMSLLDLEEPYREGEDEERDLEVS